MSEPGRSKQPDTAHTTIRPADWSREVDTVRRVFQEYRQWIADHGDPDPSAGSVVSRGLASIDQQISDLPGAYGPSRGAMLLAFQGEDLVGCGGLRELEPKVGEIKRLYVRADHRGPEFGRRLTGELLHHAEARGFARVRVDALPTMSSAIQYYQEMGFKPVKPYWPHPVRGAVFFEYALTKTTARPGPS